MTKKLSFVLAFSCLCILTKAQKISPAQQLITNEDSLNAGAANSKTVISGYGSASYQRDFNAGVSTMNLDRAVLFVGHRFTDKLSFFSELEVEDAKVEGGTDGGEVAMEQAYIKFDLNPKQYIVAGLFVPRIGILNENHLPVNFNGVERPLVETIVIPATWRELGVAFYGSANSIPLNYSIGLMNGLNNEGFEHGSGIREGRAEGRTATANNLAISAALQYNVKNFKFQISGYAGGTVGLSKRAADSLGLNSGGFGTPVYLGEGDLQYSKNAFSAKALFAYISYPEADKVNAAYAKNLATGMYGTYGELAYDLLYKKQKKAQLISFVRYEAFDLNSSIPAAPFGIYDGTEKQSHLLLGLGYLPIPNVVIKADVRLVHTGPQNPALVINPPPNALPYRQNDQVLNLGIGYSF